MNLQYIILTLSIITSIVSSFGCYICYRILKKRPEKIVVLKKRKVVCFTRCQHRRLIYGNYNSPETIWECAECHKVYFEDSQNGLERNMVATRRHQQDTSQ